MSSSNNLFASDKLSQSTTTSSVVTSCSDLENSLGNHDHVLAIEIQQALIEFQHHLHRSGIAITKRIDLAKQQTYQRRANNSGATSTQVNTHVSELRAAILHLNTTSPSQHATAFEHLDSVCSAFPLLSCAYNQMLLELESAFKNTSNPAEFSTLNWVSYETCEAFIQKANTLRSTFESKRNQLAQKHLRLAASIARSYSNQRFEFQDAFQEASIALLRAAEGFDPGRELKFTTYATPKIKGALSRSIERFTRTVRRPTDVLEKIRGLNNHAKKLHLDLDHIIEHPSSLSFFSACSLLAEQTQWSTESVRWLLSLRATEVSLDAQLFERPDTAFSSVLSELTHEPMELPSSSPEWPCIPHSERSATQEDPIETLEHIFKALSDRERFVLCSKFGVQVGELTSDHYDKPCNEREYTRALDRAASIAAPLKGRPLSEIAA